MKRKLIAGLAALVLVGGGLVSCSNKEDEKVLSDSEYVWVAHGQFLLGDGETVNGWNGKANSLYEQSTMTASSFATVKSLSGDVYNALKKKSVVALYTIDVVLGVNDAGWTKNCMKDGALYQANGSYAIKAAQCTKTSELDDDSKPVTVYSESQWIPDPKTAHVENLTPSTLFMPVWQEAADENGFSWGSDPVCIGGSGKYTLVAAKYSTVSSASEPGFGFALVKKEDIASDNGAYTKVEKYVVSDHTYGVVGKIKGEDCWENDVAMTAAADGKSYSVTLDLDADDAIKVRADGGWTRNWGTADGGNIVISEAGSYEVKIADFTDAGGATVTVTKK